MEKPMLSAKQKELLNILLRQQQKSTVEQYARQLNVSKRTVYSYLDLLEPELNQRGYTLLRSPGQGLRYSRGKPSMKKWMKKRICSPLKAGGWN
ncbi:HTH domain-containing protein [Dielma fastidiosa]|uniref:HTH domain-containing protein n=1 Tax=Dielma fastidiosa TaxID=1034346 RepID=UPI0015FC3F95|nr:HTH domain-containing protein [Dielma fastidiosa]